MNEQQINELQAGKELDALVAEKVFGYKTHGNFREANGIRILIKSYSEDISAAWEVVEKMLHMEFSVPMPETSKFNSLLMNKRWIWDITPEAICKAALLAVMEEGTKDE